MGVQGTRECGDVVPTPVCSGLHGRVRTRRSLRVTEATRAPQYEQHRLRLFKWVRPTSCGGSVRTALESHKPEIIGPATRRTLAPVQLSPRPERHARAHSRWSLLSFPAERSERGGALDQRVHGAGPR